MLGVLVNVGAILLGGTIGLFLNKGLNEKVKKVIMQGIGLSTIIIGIGGAIVTENVLLLVISLALGGTIGALLKIEDKLDNLGLSIEKKFSENGGFAKGFVLSTLIYCVGAMAIIGSIEAGVNGDNTTLYIKSILDGVTAIVFTATLGYGVIFSSIPVFIYQGSIVVLSKIIAPYMTSELINEISAVGGVLILGIAFTLLEIKKIHLGDLLPALLVPVIWFIVSGVIGVPFI